MIDQPVRRAFDRANNIRIGAVRYLNSKPLIEDLERFAPNARLILDLPSRLADDLSSGHLDVALIPSVEAFMDPEYEIISDACVAARGPVLSVKMFSRVHPGQIRTLALDEGSRTSAALLRILLSERYGVTPLLNNLPLGADPHHCQDDAVLVIGDRAMPAAQNDYHTVWDLGEQWHRWTGLPFVFAMWVTRTGTELHGIKQSLVQARDHGIQSLPQIARREAPTLGISEQQALDYLQNNLHFQIGSAERTALKLFRKLAQRLGVVPDTGELRFRASSNPARRQDEPALT